MWMHTSDHEAKRHDRSKEGNGDQDLAACNEMLAQAGRSREAEGNP